MGRVFDYVANCRDGVFAVDRHQSIVLWNRGATHILGYSRHDVVGKPCYMIMRGRDADGCATCRRGCDAIAAAERLELPATVDVLAQAKDGREVWLNVSTMVVPSRREDLSVLVHLFREVTRQQELLRVVQDFAHVVSDLAPTEAAKPRESVLETDSALDLTPREREVLQHLATGISTTEIADLLCVSPRTAQNHISNILNKLGVHSRLEAVTYSFHNGLV